MSTRRRWLGVLGGVLAVVVVAAVVALVVSRLAQPTAPGAANSSPRASPSPSPTPLSAEEIFDLVLPSVVIVRNEGRGDGGREFRGLGTGTIISRDGMILTAAHVVGDASTVEVEYADGTVANAQVLSADPTTDIATLAPDAFPEVLVPAVLGGGVEIGSRVVAIGHPLGLVASTTEGVVSGLDRSISAKNGTTLAGLIQFDAAVNPGSSGGPLINDRGQVVGVVSALADPSDDGYFIGIGFAVPIGQAVAVGRGGEEPER